MVAEDELAALRARAYGPHPDIADDPEALARLRALESAHHPAPAPAPGAAVPSTPPRVIVAPPRPPLPTARRRRPLSGRALAAAWAASLAAVALAAGGATAAVFVASADHHDATLRPVTHGRSDAAATTFGVTGDVTTYEELAGIQVLTASPDDNVCLLVQARPSAESRYEVDGDCAPRGLPVSADLVVRQTFPDAVRARYALGTVLRFTFSGGVVTVDAVPPSPDQPS